MPTLLTDDAKRAAACLFELAAALRTAVGGEILLHHLVPSLSGVLTEHGVVFPLLGFQSAQGIDDDFLIASQKIDLGYGAKTSEEVYG